MKAKLNKGRLAGKKVNTGKMTGQLIKGNTTASAKKPSGKRKGCSH